jgi:hypothetical protein
MLNVIIINYPKGIVLCYSSYRTSSVQSSKPNTPIAYYTKFLIMFTCGPIPGISNSAEIMLKPNFS